MKQIRSGKYISRILAPVIILYLSSGCTNNSNGKTSIIPSLFSEDVTNGSFSINRNTIIFFSDNELESLAILLQAKLKILSGIEAEIKAGSGSGNCINLLIDKELGQEEYKLEVSASIELTAADYSSLALK